MFIEYWLNWENNITWTFSNIFTLQNIISFCIILKWKVLNSEAPWLHQMHQSRFFVDVNSECVGSCDHYWVLENIKTHHYSHGWISITPNSSNWLTRIAAYSQIKFLLISSLIQNSSWEKFVRDMNFKNWM